MEGRVYRADRSESLILRLRKMRSWDNLVGKTGALGLMGLSSMPLLLGGFG